MVFTNFDKSTYEYDLKIERKISAEDIQKIHDKEREFLKKIRQHVPENKMMTF
ncbi:MAG: hypothetical protein ACTSRW_00230 [Candidatus Helarchaeota archaeon]